MSKEILDRCEYNLESGCDTIDLHIDRPRSEVEELYPGGPRGVVVARVQGKWVVNFKIEDVKKCLS